MASHTYSNIEYINFGGFLDLCAGVQLVLMSYSWLYYISQRAYSDFISVICCNLLYIATVIFVAVDTFDGFDSRVIEVIVCYSLLTAISNLVT